MLTFPLPPVPNPSLSIGSLDSATYRQLCELLDQENRCSELQSFTLRKLDQNIPSERCTSKELLSSLNKWNCTVEVLIYLLENSGIHEPLILLKDAVPVEIIRQPPSEIVVEIHQHVELSFEVTGFPNPNFQWFCNSVKLDGATSNPLIFRKFRTLNVGTYTCQITQQCRDGSFLSLTTEPSKVDMELFAPRVVEEPLDCCNVAPGDFVELSCLFEGLPPPQLQWYKDDHRLLHQNASKLQINSAMPSDSGRYRCFATNSEGKASTREATVCVYEKFLDTDEMHSIGGHLENMINLSQPARKFTASIKLALLIGNWTYEGHRLTKVRSDVKTLHGILNWMGFEVISLCNLDKVEILNATRRFCNLLLPNAYVVVYFAGHGIHHFSDFLMPVDLLIDSDYSLRDLVNINEIINHIQQINPKLLVVFLDMCRTFPGEERRIRGEMPREIQRITRSNLVLLLATSENSPAYEVEGADAENGIFMTYLKRVLTTRISVSEMLISFTQQFQRDIPEAASDQRPETYSSLAEPLSLFDPVERHYVGSPGWNERHLMIVSYKEPPLDQEIRVQLKDREISIWARFRMLDDCFNNALEIELTAEKESLTFVPSISPRTLQLLEVSHDYVSGKCHIAVHRLHTLLEDSYLYLRIDEYPSETVQLNLYQPLIAKACISRNDFSAAP